MESPKDFSFAFSILIVEDSREAGEALGRLIAMEFPGAKVNLAGDGLDGLTFFKKYKPDLVITDIYLRGMDGIQMLSDIRSVRCEVKIIVVTGYSETSHRHKVSPFGIEDYFLKPVQCEMLYTSIKRCFAEIAGNRAGQLPPVSGKLCDAKDQLLTG